MRLGRQVVGGGRAVGEGLDPGHEDAGPAAPPVGQGSDTGGRIVGAERAPLARGWRPRVTLDAPGSWQCGPGKKRDAGRVPRLVSTRYPMWRWTGWSET